MSKIMKSLLLFCITAGTMLSAIAEASNIDTYRDLLISKKYTIKYENVTQLLGGKHIAQAQQRLQVTHLGKLRGSTTADALRRRIGRNAVRIARLQLTQAHHHAYSASVISGASNT